MGEKALPEGTRPKRGGSVLSRWKTLVLVPALAGAITFVAFSGAGPRYRGEARLLLDGNGAAEQALLAGQAEIIASSALLNRVARTLDLDDVSASDANGLLARLGAVFGNAEPRDTPQGRAVATLRDGLEVVPVGSRMLAVRMSSADRDLAARAPNALAEAYLTLLDAARLEPAAAGAFDPAVARLAETVRAAEERLEMARSAGAARAQDEAALHAAEARIAAASEATLSARTAISALQAVARGAVSSDGLPDHPVSDALRGLSERRAEARARIEALSRTLLDNHPDMRAARAEAAGIEREFGPALASALETLRSEVQAREADEARFAAARDKAEADAARSVEASQQLSALAAAAAEARSRFDAELSRYHPSGARYLATNARLVARAEKPAEAHSSQPLPVSLAVFGGTLLALLLLMLAQSRLQAASDRRALRQALDPIDEVAMPLPVLEEAALADEVVPVEAVAKPLAENLVSDEATRPIVLPARLSKRWFAGPAGRARQAGQGGPSRLPKAKKSFLLQGGRAQMQHADQMNRMGELDADAAARRLIAGTSTRAIFVSPEGDEAAAVAILTARAMADAGLRVILIDLTASGAASRPLLEQASVPGITDLLVREAQFTDAIHQDHFSDCHVIPVGMADPSRAMRVADRLPVIVDSLTAAYDIVLIECGPADADSIGALVTDDSQVIVSLIEADEDIARAADELIAAGYSRTMVVTPGGRDQRTTFSREAIRDRWLADKGAEA